MLGSWFPLPRVVWFAAAAALLLGLFGWTAWQQQRLAEEQETLRETVELQRREIAELERELGAQQVDPSLRSGAAGRQDGSAGAAGGATIADGRGPGQGEAFALGLMQLAMDALARNDAARQRALVAYLASLPEQPFRSQMLSMLRDRAGDPVASKQAGAALRPAARAGHRDSFIEPVVEPAASQPDAHEPENRSPAASTGATVGAPVQGGGGQEAASAGGRAPEPKRRARASRLRFGLVESGRAEGWDYDLLVCTAALDRHDPYLDGEVSRLLDSLRQADPLHGRIRLAPLEEDLRQRDPELGVPGTHYVLTDDGRTPEAAQAQRVAKRLNFDGFDFVTRLSTTPVTPWRLDLAYCPE